MTIESSTGPGPGRIYEHPSLTANGQPPSSEILVGFHVEPHREEGELRTGDQQQRDEHDRADARPVAGDAVDELDDPEHEAGERREEARTRRRRRADGSRG